MGILSTLEDIKYLSTLEGYQNSCWGYHQRNEGYLVHWRAS